MMTSRSYNTRSQNIDDSSNTFSTTSSVATSKNITAIEKSYCLDLMNYQVNF